MSDMVIPKKLYKSLKHDIVNDLSQYLIADRLDPATITMIRSGVTINDEEIITINHGSRCYGQLHVNSKGIITKAGMLAWAFANYFGIFDMKDRDTIVSYINSYVNTPIDFST